MKEGAHHIWKRRMFYKGYYSADFFFKTYRSFGLFQLKKVIKGYVISLVS